MFLFLFKTLKKKICFIYPFAVQREQPYLFQFPLNFDTSGYFSIGAFYYDKCSGIQEYGRSFGKWESIGHFDWLIDLWRNRPTETFRPQQHLIQASIRLHYIIQVYHCIAYINIWAFLLIPLFFFHNTYASIL